ncbi:hypothetical protein BF93_11095 [Brachybacterium phenoliresistens]|uniref:Uncharacterized protein n=1 Tax=Brachybacterium phenoliresistens TaxID=396014 RepID=Z9JW76_9MICO|nr:hypothetical protein [Brachybacterium phenoliresistens]EWS82454.1 hypothetical protein BF93_11095 [Brachybacterium phenoliresistens]
MWYVPENDLLRVAPFAVVAALCLWGLISPRTSWRLLWGWQQRYRRVEERDRPALVRRQLLLPLILAVVLGLVMWLS